MTNFVLAVGDGVLAFGSDGKLVTTTDTSKAITVDNVKYIKGDAELVPGAYYSKVTK